MSEKIYIYIGRHLCVSSVWLFIIFHNEIFPIDVTLHRSVLKKKPNQSKTVKHLSNCYTSIGLVSSSFDQCIFREIFII